MSPIARTAPAWALLALVAVAAAASAQVAPDLHMAIAPLEAPLDAGAESTTTLTVENRGDGAGEVRLTVAQAPEGWRLMVSGPRAFTLDAGASREVPLTIIAPDAPTGADAADLTVEGTIESALTGGADAAAATVRAEVAFPPTPDSEPFPWLPVLAAAAAGAAALSAAAARVVRRRRLEVRLVAPEAPGRALPGLDAHFRVAVENRGKAPAAVGLRVASKPPSWFAAFAVPRVELAPGERREVAVAARPPRSARAGDAAAIDVVAEVEGRLRGRPSGTLRVQVTEPEVVLAARTAGATRASSLEEDSFTPPA